MRKLLKTIHLVSIARSFCKSEGPAFGGKNGAGKVNGWRSLTTSNVQSNSSYGRHAVTVKWSWQLEIVTALRLGNRSLASNRLTNPGHIRLSFTANDFIYILEYCAQTPDPLFAMQILRTMEEKEIEMNCKSYFLIIQALCKGGYVEEAFGIISFLRESPDHNPVLPMYNNLLGACVEMHSLDHVYKCLDLMDHDLVGKNEITYMELLKLAVLQRNLSAVHSVWKEFTKYYSISIISLKKYIWSCASLGDLNSAYGALQQMVALECHRESIISRSAEGKMFISRLDIPIPCKRDSDCNDSMTVYKTFVPSLDENYEKINSQASGIDLNNITDSKIKEISSGGIRELGKGRSVKVRKVLRWSYNYIIYACADTHNVELAEHLFLQMQNLGVEPSRDTCNGFIKVLVRERGFHDGIRVLKLMQQKNLMPSDSTLAFLAVSCSKGLELDFAETFLDQISKCPYPYPYNAFLEACDILDKPERAIQMVGKMRKLNVQPDIRTYEVLFSLFGKVSAPYEKGVRVSQVDVSKRIKAIDCDMLRHGIQHSRKSMKNLLKTLGREGMIKELLQYVHLAEDMFSCRGSFLNTTTYNTVLHSLVEAGESQMAIQIFKNMLSFGYRPDKVTYNVMIDCSSIIRSFKFAFALVSMMIRDGFCLETPTYTTLMKIPLASRQLLQPLRLLNQALGEGVEADALFFNSILQVACVRKNLYEIERLLVGMHEAKVRPDSYTCSIVVTAYVNSGFFNTAMEALQVLSMRMISEEYIADDEKRRFLEEHYIYAEDSEDAVLRILKLFKDKEDLAFSLLNLRWCAVNGKQISWEPKESDWTKRLFIQRRFSSIKRKRKGISERRFIQRIFSARQRTNRIRRGGIVRRRLPKKGKKGLRKKASELVDSFSLPKKGKERLRKKGSFPSELRKKGRFPSKLVDLFS